MNTERGPILLAALNHSPAVYGVLTAALGIAEMVGADVEALHVSEGSQSAHLALSVTDAAGVHLHERTGPVAETILDALQAPEMVGAVMGTRALRVGPRPTGSTARRVMAGMPKPVVFVPPEACQPSAEAPKRLLVPLDGGAAASTAFLELERRFRSDPEREITVLLTFADDGEMPSMLDHPTRDLPAWGRTFVDRCCPGEGRLFEARTGDPGSAVIEVAEKTKSDLIVLSFKGTLERGHGWVVQEVLARSVVPVLLLPVAPANMPADVAIASVDDAGHMALQ